MINPKILTAIRIHHKAAAGKLDATHAESMLCRVGIDIDWENEVGVKYTFGDGDLTIVDDKDRIKYSGTGLPNVTVDLVGQEYNGDPRIEIRSQTYDRLILTVDNYGRGPKIGAVGSLPMCSLEALEGYAEEISMSVDFVRHLLAIYREL